MRDIIDFAYSIDEDFRNLTDDRIAEADEDLGFGVLYAPESDDLALFIGRLYGMTGKIYGGGL